ncbi:sugar transferase [Flavobacterium sp.]|uniref:sugar transferase n=1 Tax=Flavobacterium sp. TaxID=239 RepID=UPI00262797E0|nr:sugar transferase [Flavobacterium sp.]
MQLKRIFDLLFSVIALILVGWLIVICFVIASLETQSNGIFKQKRVGQFGKLFTIFKLKTMHPKTEAVTFFGKYFRKYKLDELPQFYNVLIGDMSIVGPRPDVPGYYDQLTGEERKILELKPGITSEASLKYYNEDAILEQQQDPVGYNDTVIFPDKVRMNLDYYYKRNFNTDLKIIWQTIF